MIYYSSKTLNDAQTNYSTIENELLAIVFSLYKFRSYLLGSKVLINLDHAALLKLDLSDGFYCYKNLILRFETGKELKM